MSPHAPLKAAGLALTAAALWGTTGTAQHLAPGEISPFWVGALRLGIASVFFVLVVAWLRRTGRAHFLLDARSWGRVLAAGLCMAVYNLAFFAGVKAVGVALGTLVAIGCAPVWAGLIQALTSRQAPPRVWWAGTLLAVTGVALLLAENGMDQPFDAFGLGLCLLTGLSYACYTLLSQKLVLQAPPATVTLWTFSVAAVIALPAAALMAPPLVATAAGWTLFLYLGLVATGLAYLLFSHALRHLSASTCVTLALAEPLTAFVLAIVFLGERPGLTAFAGLLLLLAGLVVVLWTESRSGPPLAPH